MKTNTKFDIYIKNTRFPYIIDDSMDEYYEGIFNKIKNLISSKYNIELQIHLIYSLCRQAELIIDDNLLIIYDRYLGETFHLMTKIFLLPHEEVKISAFSCKLIAEALRKSGQFDKALPYACITHDYLKEIYSNNTNEVFYISMKYFYDADSIESSKEAKQKNIFECDLNGVHRITLISEVFIIFHEISHYLMHTEKLVNYTETYRAECEVFVESESAFFQHLLASVQQSSRKVFNSESYKENIIDEMLCDRLAIENTVSFFENDFEHDYIALSILVCSLHLRWLKHIDLIANYPNKISQYYDTVIRSHFIRDILGKVNLDSSLIQKSMPIVDQYHYVFYNRDSDLIDLANNKSFMEKCRSVYGKYMDSDFITASVLIDSLIGWNTYGGKI